VIPKLNLSDNNLMTSLSASAAKWHYLQCEWQPLCLTVCWGIH